MKEYLHKEYTISIIVTIQNTRVFQIETRIIHIINHTVTLHTNNIVNTISKSQLQHLDKPYYNNYY